MIQAKRWRIVFDYKTDSEWDRRPTSFQCFMESDVKPSKSRAARFAQKFASNWTGWPVHRLRVWVENVLEA